MSGQRLPAVADLVISRQVGPRSMSRGSVYAKEGRVADLSWDATAQSITGTVQGGAPDPYRVEVILIGAGTARIGILSAFCTCPVMVNCKHVAALLSAASAKSRAKSAADAAAAASAAAVEAAAVEAGEWRTAIARLDSTAATTPNLRPLALQFELRTPARSATRRSYAGASRGGSDEKAYDSESVARLAVRPVTAGARGGWIKAGLTWHNVGYQGAGTDFDPAQARWFSQVYMLRGTILGGFSEFGTDWITLDSYESSLIWQMLAEAKARGIRFVSSVDMQVEIATVIEVGLDARVQDHGMSLAPSIRVDGDAVPAAHTRFIGNHGAYVFDFEAKTLRVGALRVALSTQQRALVEREAAVMIPSADMPEFLQSHYPALARSLPIDSTDGSFTAPQVSPATLVLTATYGMKQALRVDWHWRMGDGLRAPLGAADNVFIGTGLIDVEAQREPEYRATTVLGDDIAGSFCIDVDGSLMTALTVRGIAAAEFTARMLPQLEAIDNLEVVVLGDKPDYREIEAEPVLSVSVVESESNDWFDLGVMVKVEGRTVPFGPLFRALSRGAKKLLLADNSYLSLQHDVFAPLKELIEEAGTLAEWDAGPRISRYQSALWEEFEDLAHESEAALSWRSTVDGLRNVEAVPQVAVPQGFVGDLRPYQLDGYRWLNFLRTQRLGGILADDMGLGKTAQTLAALAQARAEDAGSAPMLVVAPTSVVSNWQREAARFTPELRVVVLNATGAKRGDTVVQAVRDADIVLTSYAILRLDEQQFAEAEWSGLVLDEAQFAKNPASKVHQAALAVRAPFRIAVTGTPIENNLTELWALLQIAAPGLFPSAREFGEQYRRPIEVGHDVERLERLRRRVRPFLLRRTKEAVAPELPPKQEQVLEVTLDPAHRRIYDTYLQRERQKILGLVDDLDRNRFIVFRSLTLLRMLSLDASLIEPELYADVASAKLDALLEHLDEVVGEGHQALVFSQFTSFLRHAATRLDLHGISYSYLDGSTKGRAEVIDEFRGGASRVFLISLKAGGFGLNLTEADYVFLLDPWWNPATEAQAVDRAHRMGQESHVMVYRMVASGTIEEKVMTLKEKKAELFSAVLDDDAFFAETLSGDDIRGLFEG